MAIDWDKPVEMEDGTGADVFFHKDGRPALVKFKLSSGHIIQEIDENGNCVNSMWTFRNVAPKPVRMEAWMNLYEDTPGNVFTSKVDADLCQLDGRVECRHIIWHSDGSPVDDAVNKEEYDRVCAERDSAQINASNAVRDFKELAQGSQEVFDGLRAELAQEKLNVTSLTEEIARLNALNGAEQKTVERSCDNCANGPMYSKECRKEPCDPHNHDGFYAWANWKSKR